MKKRDLERKLIALGWYFKREGGNHEIWTNGNEIQPIPRHKEINEKLAQSIIRKVEQYNRLKGSI